MQTAGSGEVAGSRVGGLSSRSCEAIRPPLKLRRHAGRGGACGANVHSKFARGVASRQDSRQITSLNRGDASRGLCARSSPPLPIFPAQLQGTLTEGQREGGWSRGLAGGKVETRDSAESLCPARIETSARRRERKRPLSLVSRVH
jgi:hypothetical protein